MVLRVFLLSFVTITSLLSAARWTCIRTRNFTLYSEVSERTGRELLVRLERLRQILGPGSELPVDVLVFSNTSDVANFRQGQAAAGFYQGGFDRDYIVVSAGASGSDRAGLHEYTHLVLSRKSGVAPLWFEEGMAEFYSNLVFERSSVVVGMPIASHLRLLRDRSWLATSVLESTTTKSTLYQETERAGVFYAQSWALVHMLNMDPRWRLGFEPYVEALGRNVEPRIAFHESFHRTVDEAIADLYVYLARPVIPLKVGAPSEMPSMGKPDPVAEDEVIAIRADIHTLLGQTVEADALLRGLARRDPEGPRGLTALASIAMRAHRLEEARGYYRRAIDAGAAEGQVLFEYAMLLRDTGASRADVVSWMQKAVAASPTMAEGHFLLGVWAGDAGQFAESAEQLRKAAALAPGQSYYWHALAVAYAKLGDAVKSRDAAYRARNTAQTEQETGMAEAALLLSEAKASKPAARPTVIVPPGWDNPKGDATVEGILTQVDCGATAKLHVGAMVLEVRDPNRVVLEGVEGVSTNLDCGVQQRAVTVEYQSATRAVTRIRFK